MAGMLNGRVVRLGTRDQPVGKVRIAQVGLLPRQLPNHPSGHGVESWEERWVGPYGVGWLVAGLAGASTTCRLSTND